MREPNTTGAHLDARGLAVTTESPEAIGQLDFAVTGLVSHRADTAARIERALTIDSGLVVAHCMRGFGAKLLARADCVPPAIAALDAARSSLADRGGTERERLLVESLASWCAYDPIGAVERLEQMLTLHPRDLLVVKLSHAVQFMLGRTHEMRRSIERVLPQWNASVPGFAFVLGCHAFTLGETGELERADSVGRRAYELDATDVWGAHAVAHVFEMRGRPRDGLAWLARVDVAGVNNFAGHIAWHRALCHFALGEHEDALALHDAEIATHLARDYRDVANASTLLWRLASDGVAVGDRWQRLAALARERVGDHALGFADIHYVLALVHAGDHATARGMIASMRACAAARPGVEAATLGAVAVPVAEAIADIGSGTSDALARGIDRLLALRRSLVRLGGSHVQRDVLELVLVDAVLRAGRTDVAERVLDERLQHRPNDAWARARLTDAASGERAVA